MAPRKPLATKHECLKASLEVLPSIKSQKLLPVSLRKPHKATERVAAKKIVKIVSKKRNVGKLNEVALKAGKSRNVSAADTNLAIQGKQRLPKLIIKKRVETPQMRKIPTVAPKSTKDSTPQAKGAGRLLGEIIEPHQFKLGQIISIASHEEVYQDPRNKIKLEPTREQTLTTLGWVYSKNRKIVVTSRFAQHLVGLPIYSHGGKGLEKKEKSEFVGIRDARYFRRSPTELKYANLLSHRAHPFTLVDKKHWAVINGDSYVQFTRPLSFAYNTRCTIEGNLNDEDVQALIDLANSNKPV
ncbi:uncharacterized protein RCO7_02320 [Rhynchosporium graminicola]|uniref:DUF6590 domain-containing protein n=1 Tax=Rhynchosporium graminicola TaxID=2792576 RepID=A0A1E1JVW9_9HELO|nr:uncharacterized protein RCO7_02320 [Rhynchosporium commune]